MAKFIIEEVSPIERRIKVEVEPERVQAEIDNAYRYLSKQVRVEGFRPGKVPRRILEARYKHQVESEAVQRLVARSYGEAINANPDIYPVSQPRVTNEGLKLGEPFRYQAHVEVKPKLEPKDYDSLELKKLPVNVTDEQVDAEIERLRNGVAQITPVEGRTVAQEGDFAEVDFEGLIDGKPFPGSKAQNAMVEVSSTGNIAEGSVPALVGASVGDVRDVEHTFADDSKLAELAGKTAKFKVHLKNLKNRVLPALDDQLAKTVGAGSTLQELKDRIRQDFTEQEKEKAERDVRNQLIGQLIQRNPFDAPKSMIERRIDQILEGALERFSRQGIDPRRMNLDIDGLRSSLRESATTEVKGALLLEAIALKEQILPSPQEIDARIKTISERVNVPEQKVRAQILSGNAGDALRAQIREEKTLVFLESKARIQ